MKHVFSEEKHVFSIKESSMGSIPHSVNRMKTDFSRPIFAMKSLNLRGRFILILGKGTCVLSYHLDRASEYSLNLQKSLRERKMSRISAVLLGAGESKRMGVDKLSLPWGRKTVLEHCFETLLRSKVQKVVIVLGYRNQKLKNLFQAPKAKIVVNRYSKKGMSSSIRKGLEAVHPRSDGILIALGDQPFLKTRTINALIRAYSQAKEGILFPAFQGRSGHPVIFHKRYKRELLNLKGDSGGKSIIERHPGDIRVVPVKSVGVVKDIDTWQDYRKELRMKS